MIQVLLKQSKSIDLLIFKCLIVRIVESSLANEEWDWMNDIIFSPEAIDVFVYKYI